ncbi:helix-turn-helix domain-containing protein [Bradyrhizobium sp.]|uniref:helix-turn-helix domain-containing protein n=1 Tax=Bradyrhizobium sp. TaxID=376 RepID=UPI003C639B5B
MDHKPAQPEAGTSPRFSGRAAPPGRPALPYSENEFLVRLGDRVRTTRQLRDMSRRELARRSGISQRYIAQIEAGKGNVSIVLLLRIAHAIRSD